MNDKIIADSCCDMTRELKESLGVVSVPLTMRVGNEEFVDDESLDIGDFMEKMRASQEKTSSAAPAPLLYQKAMEGEHNTYVITISSQLSGSYNSAVAARSALTEVQGERVHVLDSKSASAGETLIAIKLHELLEEGGPVDAVASSIRHFIDAMKTYFVLENFDNLAKNGRLGKLAGKLIQILNIKLIMGADGNGNIALFDKARGVKKMLRQMLALIEKSGKDTSGGTAVISHCNNPELAEQLSAEMRQRFDFKDILVVPTGGLSSMYANEKGIILAF